MTPQPFSNRFCYPISYILLFACAILNGIAQPLPVSLGRVQGGVIFVHDTAQGANNGSSWTDAFTDLQSALDIVQAGDEIWVAGGTYRPSLRTNVDDPRTATFNLKERVKLYGGFSGSENSLAERNWTENLTILSGDIDNNDTASPITNVDQITGENAYSVVTMMGLTAEVVIDGFILTAGNAISGTDLNGCSHECGGGLYVKEGNPKITNLVIQGNNAHFGGGIMLFYASNPTISNITVQNNKAENGGGMGIYRSNLIVNQVSFSGNSASYGGGLAIANESSADFTNVSVFNNMSNVGGGLMLVSSSTSMVHATIINNRAGDGSEVMAAYGNQFNIKNTIIWDASPDNALDIWHTAAMATFSDIQQPDGIVFPGEGNVNFNPWVGEPGNYGGLFQTIPLLPGSPAVDAVPLDHCTQADGVTPLTVDQRGVTRPQGRGCDMGAYEGIFYSYFVPMSGR